ncbi:MAG: phenylacetate--CoA ligase [Clostridiales bacterium]|nr:phenylacetate--CoA ligase [Clostridiales bacterium]
MFWSKDLECMAREDMKSLQLERLKKTVKKVYENVPFYKDRLSSIGFDPNHIKTLDDLKNIPFTVKDDLRDNYPYNMFAVPIKEIVRLHASSGTTGKPTVVGYTKKDLRIWSELVARVVVEAGATEDDIAQISFGYGLFTGAFGLHYGLEKIGATVVPISTGNTERQIMLMRDFGSTILVSTPSYAMYMAEVSEKLGFDPNESNLRIGLFGSEASTDEMLQELEKKWGILATENYGLSELMGPGISGNCHIKSGMHIAEDHFIPEIIDPDTGEVLPPGEQGELVLTTITREGLPILRYRTRDITSLNYEPCKCGRTLVRMDKVQGRTDDMLIIKGVNVFPSQIEGVLMNIDDVAPHYEIVVKRERYLDTLEINIEVSNAELLESFSHLESLKEKISSQLKIALQIDARVNLVEPQTLKRFEGKAQRVVDLRS